MPPDIPVTINTLEGVLYKNINYGHNEAMIRCCEKLSGHSAFIARARKCEAEIAGSRKPQKLSNEEKEEAMGKAVHWCIAHNVLKPFWRPTDRK
ncbi:MAG: hypothetical protein LBB83_03070 [Treponema sp.]|nr:hypothetical protein [Treponema sp.]